jgi:hypothetical protein
MDGEREKEREREIEGGSEKERERERMKKKIENDFQKLKTDQGTFVEKMTLEKGHINTESGKVESLRKRKIVTLQEKE